MARPVGFPDAMQKQTDFSNAPQISAERFSLYSCEKLSYQERCVNKIVIDYYGKVHKFQEWNCIMFPILVHLEGENGTKRRKYEYSLTK